MKNPKQLYSIRAVFLLICFFFYGKTTANDKQNEWIEKKKSIIFIYNVTPKDKVLLDNKFGDIKVNLWDKNEVKIEVSITVNGTEETALQVLNSVDIVGKKTEGQVRIKTNIDGEGGTNKNNAKGEKKTLSIDYQVFMPKNNALNIRNSFGNIMLPTFTAPLVIHQSFGSFIAEDITNVQSEIRLEFCEKSSIKSMSNGTLTASYSGIKMEKADDLKINNSFGNIEIKEVSRIDSKTSYSTGLIGMIQESSNFKIEFCKGFKLGEIGKNVKELEINASYSPINLVLSDNISYDFEVKTNYADFDCSDQRPISFTRNTETEDKKTHNSFNPTKHYAGKIGKGAVNCKIIVNSNFGDVRFK